MEVLRKVLSRIFNGGQPRPQLVTLQDADRWCTELSTLDASYQSARQEVLLLLRRLQYQALIIEQVKALFDKVVNRGLLSTTRNNKPDTNPVPVAIVGSGLVTSANARVLLSPVRILLA
jgi:hypothetical protein